MADIATRGDSATFRAYVSNSFTPIFYLFYLLDYRVRRTVVWLLASN